MLYMWALPRTNPAFSPLTFDGKGIYKSGYTTITADETDEAFVGRVGELMREICGGQEPLKAPSYGECQHCPLTPEDCEDRVLTEKAYHGETDGF
jgi:hypothetical protein